MPLNIVYLDDESDLCHLFTQSFESDKIKIKAFVKAEDAIAETLKNPVDLVFIDYRLPNTNGDLVAQKMKASIPKVLITGDLSVVPETPFVKIFHKPFKFQDMEDFIRDFLL